MTWNTIGIITTTFAAIGSVSWTANRTVGGGVSLGGRSRLVRRENTSWIRQTKPKTNKRSSSCNLPIQLKKLRRECVSSPFGSLFSGMFSMGNSFFPSVPFLRQALQDCCNEGRTNEKCVQAQKPLPANVEVRHYR